MDIDAMPRLRRFAAGLLQILGGCGAYKAEIVALRAAVAEACRPVPHLGDCLSRWHPHARCDCGADIRNDERERVLRAVQGR